MSLSTDAKTYPFLNTDIAKDYLHLDVLKKIDDDLDIDDKLSLLFLIVSDYSKAFREIFQLFNNAKDQPSKNILYEYVTKYSENWEEKVLEAIYICDNRKVIKKLGLSSKNLESVYQPKIGEFSKSLNRIAKQLYKLSESLDEDETESLIKCVRNDGIKYEPQLDNINYLELHMLYWMEIKYISISLDSECNLQRLLTHLKRFSNVELIYENLKHYETSHNTSEVNRDNRNNIFDQRISYPTNSSETNTPVDELQIRKINKGLCIIVNQMYFEGEQFETRLGTNADCVRLHKTFKNLGFKVDISENLRKKKLIEKISNIPKDFGTDYDCLFLCILSHGYEGCIITSDECEVTIKEIDDKICSPELKDVIKVVIVQACQGKTTGQINNSLATDGPCGDDIADISGYRNFCIFMSTMQGFSSIRHKRQGSWFIQEFCNIIENSEKELLFMDLVMKVQRLVQSKRGVMDGKQSVAQLPEVRHRLDMDFLLPKYKKTD